MPSNAGENLKALRAILDDLRPLAEDAVREGQHVIAGGMKRRAPVRTGKLKADVKETDIQSWPDGVTGLVIDTAPYAWAVEYAKSGRPYVRPTGMQDASKAESAMTRVLDRG